MSSAEGVVRPDIMWTVDMRLHLARSLSDHIVGCLLYEQGSDFIPMFTYKIPKQVWIRIFVHKRIMYIYVVLSIVLSIVLALIYLKFCVASMSPLHV